MRRTTPITAREHELLQYMSMLRTVRASMPSRGEPYIGTEDFVLRHGSFHQAAKLPSNVGLAEPKQCYANAYRLARRRKTLRYVEGWATSAIPLAHAWCIDKDGTVVDPTWTDNTGRAYFGVEVALDAVRETLKRHHSYSVLFAEFGTRLALAALEGRISEVLAANGFCTVMEPDAPIQIDPAIGAFLRGEKINLFGGLHGETEESEPTT